MSALVTINGVSHDADIAQTAETMRVDSFTPEPDPHWTHIDAAGHQHARVDKDYPTLRWVPDPWFCPDCHDEHDDGHWECRLCGEQIRPGTRMPRPQTIVTSREITVTIRGAIDPVESPAVVLGMGGTLYPLSWSAERTEFVFVPA